MLNTEALDAFLAEHLERRDIIETVAQRAGITVDHATERVGDIASEAHRAVALLQTIDLAPGARVLEIGSGPGVAAAFLLTQGVDVIGLDPITEGFGLFDAVRDVVASRVSMPVIWPTAAEQLDPATHGLFDVIFSVNVLEHMHPLDANLDGLARVLAPNGIMIHTCPNYRVPYEPHYRVPLVPGRPSLTRLFLRRAKDEPLWKSLNWITPGALARFGDRTGIRIEYRASELGAAIARLRTDPDFARRQGTFLTRTLLALDKLGVTRVVTLVPPTWQTPLTFVGNRSEAA